MILRGCENIVWISLERMYWKKLSPLPRGENKIGYNVSVGPPSSSVQTLEERKGESLKEGRRVPDIDLAFFVEKSLPIFRQLMDFLCIDFEVPYIIIHNMYYSRQNFQISAFS